MASRSYEIGDLVRLTKSGHQFLPDILMDEVGIIISRDQHYYIVRFIHDDYIDCALWGYEIELAYLAVTKNDDF